MATEVTAVEVVATVDHAGAMAAVEDTAAGAVEAAEEEAMAADAAMAARAADTAATSPFSI